MSIFYKKLTNLNVFKYIIRNYCNIHNKMSYIVVCYRQDGEQFESIYSVYNNLEEANRVCDRNNEYEAVHHPNDDVVYKVIIPPVNRQPIF